MAGHLPAFRMASGGRDAVSAPRPDEAIRTPDGYAIRTCAPSFEVWRGRRRLYRAAGWRDACAFITVDREERRLFGTSTPLLEAG